MEVGSEILPELPQHRGIGRTEGQPCSMEKEQGVGLPTHMLEERLVFLLRHPQVQELDGQV